MNNTYLKSIILLGICSFTFILMWCWNAVPLRVMSITPPSSGRYVNTEGCVIPFYDPFDASVMPFYSKPRQLGCDKKTQLTYQEGLLLKLDNSSVSYCTSNTLIRGENNDDKYSFVGATNFTQSFIVSSEFIRVKCFDKTGSYLYSNLHAFTPRNLTREKNLRKLTEKHKQENKPAAIFSVLVIGIDSLSRLNHIRLMPKTRQFLLRNLSAVDLQGYTKVAHNTYVNMTPLLTGNFVPVENKKRGITNEKGPFDKYHLIWKNFSSHGYTTMLSEDAPSIATFNYQKKGFAKPPTHHYLRPFALSLEAESNVCWKSFTCCGNRSETKVVLDYTKDFVKTYNSSPYFAWTFISRMTHDDVKNAAYIDDEYLEFLKEIQEVGILNNTILFFMSDHGVRFGNILKTEIGQKELRMPLMNIVLPTWFERKYPEVYGNVIQNANKLTSPFDIHETLKDILYFSGRSRKVVDTDKAGISLFDPIPGSRTCSQASILPHYCVCELEEIPIEDELRKKSTQYLVQLINLKINEYSMCTNRTLKSVRYVKGYRSAGHSAITFIKLFLTLTPDNAEFEATLEHDKRKPDFRLGGAISRANRYGNTADCINIAHLRQFCYCGMHSNSTTSKPHNLNSTVKHQDITSVPSTTSKPHDISSTSRISQTAFKPRYSTSHLPHTTSKSRDSTSHLPHTTFKPRDSTSHFPHTTSKPRDSTSNLPHATF